MSDFEAQPRQRISNIYSYLYVSDQSVYTGLGNPLYGNGLVQFIRLGNSIRLKWVRLELLSLQELSAQLIGKGSDKSECLLGALVILFIILIVKLEKCVLGAQKTHLTETVLLSAHNIYFGRKKKEK